MDPSTKKNNTTEDSLKIAKTEGASKLSEINMPVLRTASPSDSTSCISSGCVTTSSIKHSEADHGSTTDQGMYYYGYYPGLNGSFGEWDGQSYYMPATQSEFQPSAVQSDNGSIMYYLPGYMPYSPNFTGPVISADGQYLAQPSFYPSTVFEQPLMSSTFVPHSVAYGSELVPAYPWDPSLLYANGYQANGFDGGISTTATKSNFSSQSRTHASSNTSTSSRSSTSETNGSAVVLDVTSNSAVPKESLMPVNKVTQGVSPVFSKAYLPVSKIPSYTNQGKGGLLYPNSHSDVKGNERNWIGVNKVKARNKLQGLADLNLHSGHSKSSSNPTVDSVGFQVAPKNNNIDISTAAIKKDMYNLADFPTKYDHAQFFVIKSYSEDDVHKSIKYNVWASTPNGNKRLDNAFQSAQGKMVEKGSKCPIFLFFSVNASGQFCGVAEMLDRVDFEKSMDFWQQDKWNGYFPVKWHIIKDIPNPQFRHIILENNENKPVTNSRDTQEVNFLQGTEMLSIFKNYSSKTSILDDFTFYENRQKAMHHKRNKPRVSSLGYIPKADEVLHGVKSGDLKSLVVSLQSVELEAMKPKEGLPAAVAANV